MASWAGNHAIGGKHRTEVTEVTEAELGGVGRSLVDTVASWAAITR
jgi:hypothetical protein